VAVLEQKNLTIYDLTAVLKAYVPQPDALGDIVQFLTFEPPAHVANGVELELLPVTELLEPTRLRATVAEWGKHLPTNDLKVASSLWSKSYIAHLLYRALPMLALGGIGLDFSLENVGVALRATDGDETYEGRGRVRGIFLYDLSKTVVYPPRCPLPDLPGATATLDEVRQILFTSLFERNFVPFFEGLQSVTKASKKILWGNLGASGHGIYQFLGEKTGGLSALEQDRAYLVDKPVNPLVAPGKNPFYKAVTEERVDDPALTEPIRMRSTCCLWYKVPDMSMCLTCPLEKSEQRLARWKVYLTEKDKH
jgi:ferric iron reductase protein FhuF